MYITLPRIYSLYNYTYCAYISYKNGSLTRERIRDTCAKGEWKVNLD